MESLKIARNRLKMYPRLLAECSSTGAVYAKCVSKSDHPTPQQCEKEFQAFKQCLTLAAKKIGTRI